MLNIIGLGLNENSLTLEAVEAIGKSDEVYLETYTVDFPYKIEQLKKTIRRKIKLLKREDVEDESLVQKSKSKKISLLVYGDALSATTHIQLIQACKKNKTKYQIFHNSSILTAIGETGLSLYKFGKTTSMPRWTETWQPDSFADYIYQNLTIDAHTLLLVDIGLELKKAKQQLEKALTKHKIKTSKILLCSGIGTSEQKIICKGLEKLPNKIEKPYCFVLPASLSDFEKNVLKEI